MNQHAPIVIIGAGISGLTAALYLKRAGNKVLLLEKESHVGGRVATEDFKGYKLDRGFQVLLTEYPEAKAILDYKALDLKPFVPGALIFKGPHKMRLADVMRKPSEAFSTIFSAAGTMRDKFKILRLSQRLKSKTIEDIFKEPEMSTIQYLQNLGFSQSIADNFFRPFLSGIFLEKELRTSSRMFEFVFKMFSSGDTAIPAKGMIEIPKQLASHFDSEEIRYNTEVGNWSAGEVVLNSGEIIKASAIITSFQKPTEDQIASEFSHTTNVYFTASTSPVKEGILILNANKNSIVNNFCVISDISNSYSRTGKSLISVSLIGDYSYMSESLLAEQVTDEISRGFREASNWTFLKSIHVKNALPNQKSVANHIPEDQIKISEGVYLCGDFLLNGSINAAMKSGRLVAEYLLKQY